jgi:hypothetical protein
VVDSLLTLLLVLFVLSLVEKLNVVAHGGAAWHPLVLARPALRPYATQLMTLAAALDVIVVALLATSPVVGGVLAASAIVLYSWIAIPALATTSFGSSCRCFLGLFDARSIPGLLVRNGAVLLAAVWLSLFGGAPSVAGLTGGFVLLAPLALAVRTANRLSLSRHLADERDPDDQVGEPVPGR